MPEERLTSDTLRDLNPSLVTLGNGTLFLVWASDRVGNFSLYSKSLGPGGWSVESRLTSGPGKDSTPALLQSRNGTLWLFWTREISVGTTLIRDIYYKTYTNRVWSKEVPFATSTAWEIQPSLLEADEGTIWAVYASNKPGNQDLFYKTYRQGWSLESPLTSDRDDDRQPWIMQDYNGMIWVFWARCVSSGSVCQDDVFYKTSTNLGTSWSLEVPFTVDPRGVEVFDSEPAAVHARGNRMIYLLWSTTLTGDGGDIDVYYSTSEPILFHDLIVTSPSTPQYKPREGETFATTVRVQNGGDFPENASLAVRIDGSIIGSSRTLLQPGQSASFSYTWDTKGKALGPHDLEVAVANVQGEARTWNNQVSRKFYILSAGDVQRDGPVNILDLVIIGSSFGSKTGDPPFNPEADLNRDGRINVLDLAIVGGEFGQEVVLPPDFDLGSNLYYPKLVRGSSTSISITVRSINGLNSTITLGATTTAVGVSASFSPKVVVPPATSILTLTASPTAATGNFTLTVTGTNGTISKSINLSLTVTPADFNLSSKPAAITVVLASSGNVTITVSSVGGFSQPVTLTFTGLPTGVTGTFSTNPVTPPADGSANSTLTISASTTATTGSFTVTVTGTPTSGLSKTTTFALTIVRRSTSTTVTCNPATVVVNQQTTCTVTVTDVSPGTASTPTGAASFTSSGTGTFSVPSCTLVGTGTSSSCSVSYMPTSVGTGTHSVTASYAGDTNHGISSGAFNVALFDFVLSVTPGSGTILWGGNMSVTVTAALVSGETQPVSFTVSSLPSGLTAVFTPSSCSPTCSPRVIIAATSTAALGNFRITISGTSSGGLVHSVSITVAVKPGPDFTISASPTSLTVYQSGNARNVTITLGYIGILGDVNRDGAVNVLDLVRVGAAFGSTSGSPGYDPDADINKDGIVNVLDLALVGGNFGKTNLVTLTVTGLPSGVTATLVPNALNPPGTSTLSLTASPTAATGSFTITVTGTSALSTQSVTISLTVKPPPDFSLLANPTSLTIVRGSSGTVTITITSISDFQSPVTLSASGLPNGVTASFSPNPAVPPANGQTTSTLTLTVSSSTKTGAYTIVVTGTSGSLVHSVTITLTVS